MPVRRSPRNLSCGVRKNEPKAKNGVQKTRTKRKSVTKDMAKININFMLYSPTKAHRWDPRRSAPESSPLYTLSMANADHLDECFRQELFEDWRDEVGSDCDDECFDLEERCPEWEDYVDPHSEFEWLEVIDGTVTHQKNSHSPAGDIAHCKAFLVRKDRILETFWEDMEEPEEETAELAFELFDRFGCLQAQYKSHPVKKGSGVWGDELNDGDILLISDLTVSATHRRRKIGSKLVAAILDLASKKSESFHCFAYPGVLESEVRRQTSKSTSAVHEVTTIRRQIADVALSFFRQLGFRRVGSSRWLAYSPDGQHPSRLLEADQDFDLPRLERVMNAPDSQIIDEFIKSIPTIEDAECVIRLEEIYGDAPPDDCRWKVTDDEGDSLLHLVSCSFKIRSAEWLIHRSSGLLSQRNAKGNTPLEALEACMENQRTIRGFGMSARMVVSDRFRGFKDTSIACLALLRGLDIQKASDAERNRLKYGCTCGECLGGFLSPQMQYMLLCQAEITFDFIYTFDGVDDGEGWCDENEELFEYLPKPIAQSLSTRKDSRIGFCMLWKHLATCIRNNMLPTEENVVRLIRDANEWPPHSRNFIQKGAAISSVATMLFKRAMTLEELHLPEYNDDINQNRFPACRNDREFGMVSGLCGYETINRIQQCTMQGRKIRY